MTQEQMGKAISLGVGGIIGYYGRATVVTWEDCAEIEKARAAALAAARGFTPGVPRLKIYQKESAGGMGAHEHAYSYAAAALCDQIDRALCGGKGQPDRLAVEEALAKTCMRLGCRGEHPLEWEPSHLMSELRDDLLIEGYLKAKLRLGLRGKLTAACEQKDREGPLRAELWKVSEEQKRVTGPRLWQTDYYDDGATRWDTQPMTFHRNLAALGIATWSDVTDAKTGEWLTWADVQAKYESAGLRGSSTAREQYGTIQASRNGQGTDDGTERVLTIDPSLLLRSYI